MVEQLRLRLVPGPNDDLAIHPERRYGRNTLNGGYLRPLGIGLDVFQHGDRRVDRHSAALLAGRDEVGAPYQVVSQYGNVQRLDLSVAMLIQLDTHQAAAMHEAPGR